ncbi:hypothetical protein [Cellulomonas sp. PS-H5]|uniref:hypothetical protein n=1 Tax=Cellulomonas sp. PS-H5 TaxID=2820400 RepID=UPI001C4F9B65|nr:hypothetical protein [Cellulomonas sp. PS-H5]MBW0252596.1 hypothetical protein [Cellulomonas sp. PS-H5]
MLRAIRRVTVGVLSVALLAACSSAPPQEPVDDWTSSAESPSETVSAEPEVVTSTQPAQPVILTDSWADGDGYQYEVAITQAKVEASKDVANAKPGEALISWKWHVRADATNATPERNAPYPRFAVEPLWPVDSPVCAVGFYLVRQGLGSNDPAHGADQWCTLSTVPQGGAGDSDELAIGETGVVRLDMNSNITVSIVVPEADADAVVAALQTPAVIAMGREGGTGCALANGGDLHLSVATADVGGCNP